MVEWTIKHHRLGHFHIISLNQTEWHKAFAHRFCKRKHTFTLHIYQLLGFFGFELAARNEQRFGYMVYSGCNTLGSALAVDIETETTVLHPKGGDLNEGCGGFGEGTEGIDGWGQTRLIWRRTWFKPDIAWRRWHTRSFKVHFVSQSTCCVGRACKNITVDQSRSHQLWESFSSWSLFWSCGALGVPWLFGEILNPKMGSFVLWGRAVTLQNPISSPTPGKIKFERKLQTLPQRCHHRTFLHGWLPALNCMRVPSLQGKLDPLTGFLGGKTTKSIGGRW